MSSDHDEQRPTFVRRYFLLAGVFVLLLAACCADFFLTALFRTDWSAPYHRQSALVISFSATALLWFLRLPQLVAALLFLAALANIAIAARDHKLGMWQTYVPFSAFATCAILVMLLIPIWAESSIRAKLADPEGGEVAMRAHASRVLGRWPTWPHCALSDQVAVVISYWSFMTVDGHMPVLALSESGVPSPQLPTHPTACKQLDTDWFFCYLEEPQQLTYDYSGLCDFSR